MDYKFVMNMFGFASWSGDRRVLLSLDYLISCLFVRVGTYFIPFGPALVGA